MSEQEPKYEDWTKKSRAERDNAIIQALERFGNLVEKIAKDIAEIKTKI